MKKVDYNLEIQELIVGDWFPCFERLGKNKENLEYMDAEKVDRESYLTYYGKKLLTHPYTVTANSNEAMVVSVDALDFILACPKELFFQLVARPAQRSVGLEVLQEQFLQQKSWENEKKHIRDNLRF